MTAYLALTQKVNDLDKYQETYIPQVRPLLEKYGIEVLVAQFGVIVDLTVEGDDVTTRGGGHRLVAGGR